VAPLPQNPIHRVAAINKGKHWLPPAAKGFERDPNSEIAARRDEPLFKHRDCLLEPASSLIDLSQVYVELRVVVSQSERFETKALGIEKSLLGKRGQ
jgi:hypothetical protein